MMGEENCMQLFAFIYRCSCNPAALGISFGNKLTANQANL
jgi:hypothetical protein